MLIYIDESGDPGFKIEGGSSAIFVIAFIEFDDEDECKLTATAIRQLKQKLHKPDNFEFKFSKISRRERIAFLEAVDPFAFRIRALVFNKAKIDRKHLAKFGGQFYRYAVSLLLSQERMGYMLENAQLHIDHFGAFQFRENLLQYLKEKLNTPQVQLENRIIFRNSQEDALIQLADLAAGSIRQSFETFRDQPSHYRDILRDHEHDILVYESDRLMQDEPPAIATMTGDQSSLIKEHKK